MSFTDTEKTARFSIIVPAYNSECTLAFCLQALTDQTLPKELYEIIVVDDGSTDSTPEIAHRFNVHCISQKNSGPASARNTGASVAVGDIILFTDSDCIPNPNWLEEMVKPFSDPNVTGVKGCYRTRQTGLIARFAQMEFEDRYDLLSKSRYIDMVDTYSAAFRKEVFLEMGGFDTHFPKANNEDTELSYRLAAHGYRMVFSPDAVVFHTHPATLSRYLKIKFWRGYWRMIVYHRYPRKAVKDSYTPHVLKIETALMALSFPICLTSLFYPGLFLLVLGIWTLVLALSFPFALKTYTKDRMVGLISPGIILLRSGVFAAGSLMGIAQCLINRGIPSKSSRE